MQIGKIITVVRDWQGIKREDLRYLRYVIVKCAGFAKTISKLVSNVDPDQISEHTLNNIFLCASPQLALGRIAVMCVAGMCVAIMRAILPAKLKLRNVYRLLATTYSWSDVLFIDGAAEKDLPWWLRLYISGTEHQFFYKPQKFK